MLTISRKLIRTLRAVFRKVGASADRLKMAHVAFRSAGDSVRIQCRCDDFAAEYQLAEAQPHEAFRLPLAAFADCEGGKESPVHFRLEGNDAVVAEWVDAGVPQTRRYSVTQDEAIWFERPSSMSPANDPSLCATLAEVAESTGSHVRFATHCIHLRGPKGEAVGTDGRQLLIARGLRFPWDDDILVPRTPIFACREFAAAGSLELGRSDAHCVFRAGPWTVWLPIAKNQRYPNFEQTIPAPHLAKTRLSLGRADADFLAHALPRLPGGEDEYSPVTLHLNGHAIVRAKGASGPATELFLTRSRTDGDEVRLNTNRCYLQRAAKLGLLELHIRDASTPVVANDATRTFVWVPLDCKSALGPSADAVRIDSSPL